MPPVSDKRERLVASADSLILQQGFKQTTLADIAVESGVPLGNVYYYFKTKEDIGKTVIENRLNGLQAFLEKCSLASTSKGRLLAFLGHPGKIKTTLIGSGCPLGTLAYELSRSNSCLRDPSRKLIQTLLDWASTQFAGMGVPDPDVCGLQFVCNLQGMSLLANTLKRGDAIDVMVERTQDWIQSL